MNALSFVLSFYFAAVLGVSGLAKLERPGAFARVLKKQRIFPAWSVKGFSYSVPCGEIVLALVLASGAAPTLTAIVVLALFAGFLIIETILLTTKRSATCGCYGALLQRKVDVSSLLTSSILVCLAAVQLWLVLTAPTVDWRWRIVPAIIFYGLACWLSYRTLRRRGSYVDLIGSVVGTNPTPSDADELTIAPPLKIGQVAPSFQLPDLDGNIIDSSALRWYTAIVIFLNPGCTFCHRILDKLRTLEADWQQSFTKLIIVSAGTSDMNRSLELRSAILSDPNLKTHAAFGMRGAPTAILLDESGVVLSDTAYGARGVLKLVQSEYAPTQRMHIPKLLSRKATG